MRRRGCRRDKECYPSMRWASAQGNALMAVFGAAKAIAQRGAEARLSPQVVGWSPRAFAVRHGASRTALGSVNNYGATTMQDSVTQCHFLMREMEEIASDLRDEHRALQPRPGAKTAGWLIGHIAVTGDYGRRLCGRTALCPKEWRALFNPGSQPSPNSEAYPSMEVLRRTAHDVYRDFCQAALNADQAALAIENPFVPGRADFPTAGVFVRYLMSGHLAYHLGQLTEWRAAAGLAPRRQIDEAMA